MGRGIQAYLIVRRSLRQRNVGPKKIADRVAKLFGLLTEEQKTRLEQGVLPDEECLKALAGQLAESVDTIHQELTNFLFWLEASPQIR